MNRITSNGAIGHQSRTLTSSKVLPITCRMHQSNYPTDNNSGKDGNSPTFNRYNRKRKTRYIDKYLNSTSSSWVLEDGVFQQSSRHLDSVKNRKRPSLESIINDRTYGVSTLKDQKDKPSIKLNDMDPKAAELWQYFSANSFGIGSGNANAGSFNWRSCDV